MSAPTDTFDPTRPHRLSPEVALRPEAFGALAYHYGNRRLVFLKSQGLVDLVRSLATHPSPAVAIARTVSPTTDPESAERERRSLTAALSSLAAAEVICEH